MLSKKPIISLLLLFVLMTTLVSAVWYNPFTWFGEDYDVVHKEKLEIKKFQGLEEYIFEEHYYTIDENNVNIFIEINPSRWNWVVDAVNNPTMAKCEQAENVLRDDYPNFDCDKASHRQLLLNKLTKFKDYGLKLRVKGMEKGYFSKEGNLVTISIPKNELKNYDIIEIGENSLEYTYVSESVNLVDNGEVVLETNLITEDLEYKNGKPHKVFHPGYQLTHSFQIIAYDDLENIVNDIELINMKNGDVIDKEFDVKIRYVQNVEIPTYGKMCEDEQDPYTCNNYVNGSYITQEYAWMDAIHLNNEIDVMNGTEIVLGIFMDVKQDEYIDVVPTIAGVEFDFWATIVGDLFQDLQAYYQFNDTTMVEETGNYTPTNSGATLTTGIQNQAYDFERSESDHANSGIPMNDVRTAPRTWSIWFKVESSHNGYIFDGGNTEQAFHFTGTTTAAEWQIYNGGYASLSTTKTSWNLDQWYHIVLIQTSGGKRIYVDGVLDASDSDGTLANSKVDDILFGGRNTGTTDNFDGVLDEIGVWSADLTTSVSTLYNGGAGICYNCSTGDTTPPVVNLESPANNTIVNSNGYSATFEYTPTDAESDIDNCTLNVWNVSDDTLKYTQTDLTITNGSTNSFSQTLAAANYSWNVLCVNNVSLSAENATNWTINVIPIPDKAPNIENSPNNPEGNYILSPLLFIFNFTNVYDDIKIDNVSLVMNNVINQTNTSGINNTNYIFNLTLGDGYYEYYGQAVDNTSQVGVAPTLNFTIDSSPPNITITNPPNNYVVNEFNETIQLNWTLVEENPDTCWYDFYEYNASLELLRFDDNRFWSSGVIDGWIYVSDNETQRIVFNGIANFGAVPYVRIYKEVQSKTGSYQEILANDTNFALNESLAVNGNGWHYVVVSATNIGGLEDNYADQVILQNPSAYITSNPNALGTNDTIVNCLSNTTTINYPTNNPLNVTINLYANDSIAGYIGSDSVNILKNQNSPQITLTSPATTFGFLETGDTLSVNWSITNSTTLDVCLLDYNNVNTTMNCTDTSYDFTYTGGVDNLTFFANDTLGNSNSTFRSWIVNMSEVNREYNSPVAEGTSQTFYLNVSTPLVVDELTFWYNDEPYTSSFFLNGEGNYEVSTTIIIPDVATTTNYSLFWQFGTTAGFSVNTSSTNQTVTPLNIDDCSVNNVTLFNFTMYDEQSQAFLNGTTENTLIEVDLEVFSSDGSVSFLAINETFSQINPARICLSDNLTETFLVDVEVLYTSNNREEEFYFIQKGEISNETTPINIPLYPLLSNVSTLFKINYKDTGFLPLPGSLIQIQRKYVGEGVFKIVEIARSDENGDAKAHLQIDGTIYNLVITQNGKVIDTFNDINVICENPITEECTINLNSFDSTTDFTNWDSVGGVTYTMRLAADESSVDVDFISTSGLPVTIQINSTQFGTSGVTNVCQSSLIASAGSLSCLIPNLYENVTIISQLFVGSDPKPVVVETYKLGPSLEDTLGTDAYFFVFVLLLTFPFLFISSTIGMVISIILGLILSMMLLVIETQGILAKGSAVIWLIIAGVVVIYKLARRDTL